MIDQGKILSFETFSYAAAGAYQISSLSLDLTFTQDRYLKKIHASAWVNAAIGVQLLPFDNIQLYIQNCLLSPIDNFKNADVAPWTFYNNVLNYNSKEGFIDIDFPNPLLLPQGKTIFFEIYVMSNVAYALNDEMISHISLYF